MKALSITEKSSLIGFIIATFCVLSACNEKVHETEVTPMVESIIPEGDNVALNLHGVKSFTFSVVPADAVFNYDMNDENCQIGLYKVDQNGNRTGQKPEHFYLVGVKSKDAAKGSYTATLVDYGKAESYDEKAVLEIRYDDPASGSRSVRSEAINFWISGNDMFSMSIEKEFNSTSVLESIALEKTNDGFSISSALISSPKLILSFDSNGSRITVDEVEQVSGKTMNDFSKPLVYKVDNGHGKTVEYKVDIKYSGLPVLFIETAGHAAIPSKHYDWLADTRLTLYKPDWSIDYEGTSGIRGRGNSTWGYPKKPYALKLDSKAEILGMPKHKRWVLLANWLDRTLLRNHVAFKISTLTDLAYTPRGQFVEVYLNGNHNGCYLLCEHIKVDKNRVNVDELEDDMTDSGYIMELDSYFDEVNKFRSAYYDLPYMFKDPDEVNEAQFAFIENYVNNMEESLIDDARFATREYADYIDIDSFIDFWFVQELTGNPETKHPKSTYMHKNTGGKLTMGPVWDFDWETFTPKNQFRTADKIYYERLFQDPVFKARAKERWERLLPSFREIPQFIQEEADRIRNSESMNHIMWPVTSNVNKDIDLSFEDAVAKMKKSYSDKLEWMNDSISSW